jgi:pyruvate/2-oxoglutarate dehydrogenase complex dihydrolipoamide dehydrogenase (E3) component
MTHFDAIIIGAGQAGPSLAGRLTGAGMTVALVERKLFGGTCVNVGCTPTKTLVASAYAAHVTRRGADYGVVLDGGFHVDMARVKARADAVSANSRASVEQWLRGMAGCTVLEGHARFEAQNAVRVGEALLTAPRIFINVGGRAIVPDMPGVGDVPYLTNSSILALDHLPRHLVVVGGSYVGLEFAQLYRRFGAEVTVVEMGPRLVAREDEDVSEAVRGILAGEGITVRTGAECIGLAAHERGVAVSMDCTEGEPETVGSHVLLAIGRRPNTDDLGLDRAGVATDARGYIPVDEGLATNVPGIFALGDCNARGAFTHTAYNDFEIVAANLLDGDRRRVSDRIPGYALYIDPPLGRAGMTEREARASGRPLLIGNRPMSRVARAIEKGETQGFMKIVVDAETRRILGAAILGTGGDEAIHGVLDVMNADVPYDALQRAVPIHPTVSELIPTMLSEMRPVPPVTFARPRGRIET